MNYSAETARNNRRACGLTDPGLDGVSIRSEISGGLDRIGAEQLSRPTKQCAYFVQLLLQPGISHTLTLPTLVYSHNSLQSPKHAGWSFGCTTPTLVWPAEQRGCRSEDDGRLGRWRSSVGIRRGSASGGLPENLSRFRHSARLSTAPRG
jgi:hypothetical protein